jgi:putative phosphoribosyl transferase
LHRFSDRAEAGDLLASSLKSYATRSDVVVVGLPRGGIPVAFQIACCLRAPLDLIAVRKLRVPRQPELALGAVANGGVRVLNPTVIRSVKLSIGHVYGAIAKEEEIEKWETLLRGGNRTHSLSGRTVILVDDGAVTGSTMLAAAEAVRRQHAKEIAIAVPVASREAYRSFQHEVSTCVCLATPQPFLAVSHSYESFPRVTDEEVKDLLARSRNGASGHTEPSPRGGSVPEQ